MVIATGRALLDPYVSLTHAGLKDGMSYADLGAGALGHFIFPAVKLEGENGTVFAVDIMKSALEAIRSRAREAGITHLNMVWGDIERPGGVKITPGSLQVVSLVNMGHQLKKGSEPLREARRLLVSGGTLLVVDWKPSAQKMFVAKEDIVDPLWFEAEATKVGFKTIDRFDAGEHHWGRVLQRGA